MYYLLLVFFSLLILIIYQAFLQLLNDLFQEWAKGSDQSMSLRRLIIAL